MIKKIVTIGALFITLHSSYASDQVRGVGSSTVYPFITVVAEEFGANSKYRTPIIESTGSGGGFKLFCAGIGSKTPNITNASRPIKTGERKLCAKNGVIDITEIKIGYDGIVVANSKKAKKLKLTTEQLFLALAKKVPINGKLVANPYKKWSDIDKSLPTVKIAIYGPPPTSGTRDAFVELVMHHSCVNLAAFKKAYPAKKTRKGKCGLIREDGVYVDSGENDNIIVQKLVGNKNSIGIFGYGFLEQNEGKVQGSIINNTVPTFENIASGAYPISRSLFVYVKNAHLKAVTSLKPFIKELLSDNAIGEEGYTTDKGLIPLSQNELDALRKKVLANISK